MGKPSIHSGDVFHHPFYGDYVVINYLNAHNITVYFSNTGHINTVSASEIKKGEVRDHTQVRVYGVGINDAGYSVIEKQRKGRGSLNKVKCPFWTKWSSMLERCYSGKYSAYIDTYVCDEWLTFSNFKAWMETQDWEGKQLDKDLLGDGKLYSPDTCCFLSSRLNGFLVDCNKPLCGQSKHRDGKFQARCIDPFSVKSSDRRYLGLYLSAEEAHLAWKTKKHEYACQLAELEDDHKISTALRSKFL